MTKELKVIVQGISNLTTRTRKVNRDDATKIITSVSFECETPAGKFDDIHQALAGKQEVDMMLSCPQLAMSMGDEE